MLSSVFRTVSTVVNQMHIIIGFAVVVGLLAVPATRLVMFWLAGITALGVVVLAAVFLHNNPNYIVAKQAAPPQLIPCDFLTKMSGPLPDRCH